MKINKESDTYTITLNVPINADLRVIVNYSEGVSTDIYFHNNEHDNIRILNVTPWELQELARGFNKAAELILTKMKEHDNTKCNTNS